MSHAVAKAEALKSWVHLHEPICAVLRWGLLGSASPVMTRVGTSIAANALGAETADRGRGRNGNDAPDTRIGHGFGLAIPGSQTPCLSQEARDLLRRIGIFCAAHRERTGTVAPAPVQITVAICPPTGHQLVQHSVGAERKAYTRTRRPRSKAPGEGPRVARQYSLAARRSQGARLHRTGIPTGR